MSQSKIEVKAGRYIFDQQEKKVKVSKEKGILKLIKSECQEVYLSWISLDDHIEYINLMVFPNDTYFQPLPNKKNTFILKMDSNPDRYFFWLQQKVDEQKLVKDINNFINLAYDSDESKMQEQPHQPQNDKKPVPANLQISQQNSNQPTGADDFIKRIQKNIQAANKNKPKPITHLSQLINNNCITLLMNETSQEEKKQLAEYLPQQQQQPKHLLSNIRSAQFLQAVDALTDALKSQNAISLFMEMGLDQKFLQKYYGVDAFARALEQWGNKQPKVLQKKQQKMEIEKPQQKQQ